mgnify:CR=1 FL=1|tara:strand:+ start:1474 stop:1680 length:207 start_codon:yes stop_codon:yes gene_type:complete
MSNFIKDELKWAEEESKITTKEDLISYFMKRFKLDKDEAIRYCQFLDDTADGGALAPFKDNNRGDNNE